MLLLCFVLLLSRLNCAHVLLYPLSSISIKYLMNVWYMFSGHHLVWTGNSLFAMSGHSPVIFGSVGLIEKNHNQFMVRYCVFSVLFLYNRWVTFGSVGRSEKNYNNEIRMDIGHSYKCEEAVDLKQLYEYITLKTNSFSEKFYYFNSTSQVGMNDVWGESGCR